jgi:hypothetical protein
LELRLAPARFFFVVPGNVATDSTHFHSLSDAVGVATFVGDVIQIEPNSVPGAANGDGTNSIDFTGLTIRGDPADGPANLPQIPTLVVNGVDDVLNDLNLGAVRVGGVSNNLTISNSLVALLQSRVGGGTHLVNNTFTGTVDLSNSSNDVIANNTFMIGQNEAAGLILTNESSATVQHNVISGSRAGDLTGISVLGGSPSITDNTITLNGGFLARGIGVTAVPVEINFSAIIIDNNVIDTSGGGTGISITGSSSSAGFRVSAQGNDLVRNAIGVYVQGDGTSGNNAFGQIDFGGVDAVRTSAGQNDFHGYTSSSTTSAAIVVNNLLNNTSDTVQAKNNIFSAGVNPSNVVFTYGGPGAVVTDVSGALDANRSFIANLYRDYLKRTASDSELTMWANALASMGRTGVASGIIRSGEADMRLVEVLYRKILGREADASGEAACVGLLQNGGTEEQVEAGLLASGEFAARANLLASNPASPNVNYVEALYNLILARGATGAEIDQWAAALPSMTRSGVAASFLRSGEFRSPWVFELYVHSWDLEQYPLIGMLAPNLLHRSTPPPSSEYSGWFMSSLDLLSIETLIASSQEAFNDG